MPVITKVSLLEQIDEENQNGSWLTQVKTSNMWYKRFSSRRHVCVYVCLYALLGYFTDVTADFQSKMPVISTVAHCDAESYKLLIVVSNPECVETSQLLSVYSQLDPRVRPLVIAFRYWAKVSTVVDFVVMDVSSLF